MTLTEKELIEITGYKQTRKQKIHFDRLGVPNIIRPDNTLSVARVYFQQLPLASRDGVAKSASVRIIRKPAVLSTKSK